MSVYLDRKKDKLFLVRLVYLINRFLPVSDKTKFKLFLNLEWIFDRMSHEYSFKNYDEKTHPIRSFTKDFLSKYITSEHNVLDLGCNEGVMTNYLADLSKMAVGVDYNSGAIDRAKNKYLKKNLRFYDNDAYDYLTQTDEKFDVLILSHILEHLDDAKDFLNKFSKFFDYIYIELPDFDRNLLNHYRKNMDMPLIYMDDDHVVEFDRYDLVKLLEESNLSIVEANHIYGIHRIWCKTNKK